MADTNDIPRGMKMLQVFWPIVLAGLLSGASVAATSAKVTDLDARLTDVQANGAPVTRERLARIEATQAAQGQQLTRIEQKLDDLDKRSRERNLNGL